jgi:hypothetical protein
MAVVSPAERLVFGLSLIAGPLLFAVSSFFWTTGGEYGVRGGTTLAIGSVFWIVAFVGIFGELRSRTPRYAAWGLLVAVYGAICGGAAFAFQGMFAELYDVTHEQALAALARHPIVANAIFWIGGPAFPVTLLVLGIVLVRTRTVPWWMGTMLALGGALFPVARIPRIELIAHAVDLLMLIPGAYMGRNVLRGRSFGGGTLWSS